MKQNLIIVSLMASIFLGWLFVEQPEPRFLGATKQIQLKWLYSYTTDKYSTVSGDLEPGTYVLSPIPESTHFPWYGDYLANIDGKITRVKDIPNGFTEVNIVGEKAFNVFEDPETKIETKEEITKVQYKQLGVKDAVKPTKVISKPLTWNDIFGVKTAHAAISRHCNIPVGAGASDCKYSENASTTSLTFAYDTGTAVNRVLVVLTNSSGTPSGITYNGTAVTRRVDSHFQVSWSGIWILEDPSTGSNNVVVSFAVNNFIQAVAMSYDGADTYGDTDSTFGTAANPTLTALTTTSPPDDSFVVVNDGQNTNVTTNAGQNIIVENEIVTGTQTMSVSDKYVSPAQTQNMGYTVGADQYDFTGIEIKGDGLAATAAKPRRLIIN